MPWGDGRYVAREDYVRYLCAYCEHHALDVRTAMTVDRVEWADGGFRPMKTREISAAAVSPTAVGIRSRPRPSTCAGAPRASRETTCGGVRTATRTDHRTGLAEIGGDLGARVADARDQDVLVAKGRRADRTARRAAARLRSRARRTGAARRRGRRRASRGRGWRCR